MPRRGSKDSRDARDNRDRDSRPERARPERRPSVNVDEEALSLREGNESYSSIARRLTLRRATDAHRAFIRAVSSRSGDEQRDLVAHEHARLDKLEQRIRSRDAGHPEKVERRLEALSKLRAALP